LVIGYFTCGFQLNFVTLHLPSYLIDRGLSAEVGGWTLGIIGLFNIVGALASGYLASRMPKRYILAFIYSTRRPGRGDVRHALAGDAGGYHLPEPSDWRIAGRLSWRLSL
jgi:MFS family permease